jgi:hypothetical protein
MKRNILAISLVFCGLIVSSCSDKPAEVQLNESNTPVQPAKMQDDLKAVNNNVPASKNSALDNFGTLIPRSMKGDKGTYYLLKLEKVGTVFKVIHKRVGVDSVGFTKTEINCSNMTYRVIGYSEQSIDSIIDSPSDWTRLVEGSSKSDLVRFVCKK